MNKPIVLILLILMLGLTGCDDPLPDPLTISWEEQTIYSGSEITLSADVSSPESMIGYQWTISGGEIVSGQNSESVLWRAPFNAQNMTFTISVLVEGSDWTGYGKLILEVEGGVIFDSRDGNSYEFVEMGDQIWMAENLAFYDEINEISEESDSYPKYYIYGFDPYDYNPDEYREFHNYVKFGILYNWEAARISCPEGWHLPSEGEWKDMELYLGMSASELDAGGSRESGEVGKKLKGTDYWESPGSGDNSSGFNARPGGSCTPGWNKWENLGFRAYFWTSTATPESQVANNTRILTFDSNGVGSSTSGFYKGLSVRCIKDD